MANIRTAAPDDQESIRNIYTSVTGSVLQEDDCERLIGDGGLLVAEVNGRLIAFGGIDLQAMEQVKWLYVLPENQVSGVGSKLLRSLEHIGWRAGLSALRVHSAPDATEFYRKHGYRRIEEQEPPGHDHEGVEMVKERE
jgi:GNAT superfamily N-acetyltransferase